MNQDSASAIDWKDALSPEERRELLTVHPWRGWVAIATNWGLVFAAMALVAWSPGLLSILLALFVIGGRQLGMAIVMHEAAHRTLFRSRKLNDWAGSWLAAYPVWTDLEVYRPYHLLHHAKTGTDADPDLGLAAPFPITRASLARKVWRDLSGSTGWKQAKGILKRDLGIATKQTQRALGMSEGHRADVGWHRIAPVAMCNAVLLGILAFASHPELYLLWVGAWLTTYRLVSRLRSIAEHGMVPDQADPLKNTRTTLAHWWERLLVAPNYVNFHLEHHLMMTVPHYNLPRMHRLLRDRGALRGSCITRGYLEVVRLATERPAA
jgi:fatty acid desaturase